MTDNQKLDLILEKIDSLDREVKILDQKINNLYGETDTLKIDVKKEITNIHLTLEDEIRVNIMSVIGRYRDFSKRLDEYIKLSNKIEAKQVLNDIYINMHTNKLRALSSSL